MVLQLHVYQISTLLAQIHTTYQQLRLSAAIAFYEKWIQLHAAAVTAYLIPTQHELIWFISNTCVVYPLALQSQRCM